MKQILLLVTIIIMSLTLSSCDIVNSIKGCPDTVDAPSLPYGSPDDDSWYESEYSLQYSATYYCQSGRYVSLSYTYNNDKCEWELTSEFTSSGICN